jgi:hypothetical protein
MVHKAEWKITKGDVERARLDALMYGGWERNEFFKRLKASYKTQEKLK